MYLSLDKTRKLFPFIGSYFLFLFSFSAIQAQSNQTVNTGQASATINFPGNGCVYNWVNDKPSIGLPAGGTGDIASFTAVNTSGGPIVATITATSVPGVFAYVLSSTGLVVVNTTNNDIVANVALGSDPVGITVNGDGSIVYVTNLMDGTVSVVSTATNTVITTIPVGSQPYGIVVSADGKRVYVANSASNNVSIIDATTNKVIKKVAVGNNPTGITISPDGKLVYISNINSGSISVLSTATNTIISTVPVGPAPYGIAISPDGGKIYVVNAADNTVSVINTTTNTVTATISVGQGPLGVAMSTDGSRAYVANQNSGTVSVINTSTNTVIATIPVGESPGGISVSPDGSLVYAALNTQTNSVVIISTSNNQVSAKINLNTSALSFGNFIIGRTSGCPPVKFTITVNPDPYAVFPAITAGNADGTITACQGSPSASPNIQQLKVSGDNLTGSITATSPAGFEVSLAAGSGYSNSVIIPQINGTVSSTIVYVRSAANVLAGNISGNVVLSSTGATNQNVAVTGIIKAVPTVNAVANQTVSNGAATTAINFTGTGNTFTWVNDTPGIGLAASGSGDINSFTAVNKGTNSVTAKITVTPVPAVFAYLANSHSNSVSVINTITKEHITDIPVGTSPFSVAVSPDGSRVYVSNDGSGSISVINTATNNVITNITVSANPQSIAISPDGSRLYVVYGEDEEFYSIVNTSTNSVTNIPTTNWNYGVAVSPDGRSYYIANNVYNTLSIVDASSNSLIASIPAGAGPYKVLPSSDGIYVYVTNYFDNTVSVINRQMNIVTATIAVGLEPTAMALSRDGSFLYVVNVNDNTVSVISTANNTLVKTINVGTTPSGISVTPDGKSIYVANYYSNNVSVINEATNTVTGTVAVGANPLSFGNFIASTGNCTGVSQTFTITVTPMSAATISKKGMLSPLATVYGSSSSSERFQVSGINLTSGILVTPPAGFEVSLDNSSFSKTVLIGAADNISATYVYIRLAATTPVGSIYSGDIILSATGAEDLNVAMPNSEVTPALLTVTPDNKGKAYGTVNPILTATYNGFVNDETVAQITVLPELETSAVASSPVGTYPITASGATADNYAFLYNAGILTIVDTPHIPNVFTPNLDGHNDTWNITDLDVYPNCLVNVYDRYGQIVHSSHGYSIPWNGAKGNVALPNGTYYYIIDLNNGKNALSGYVTIIR